MKIKDLEKMGNDKYLLLDAGEVWDLEISLEGLKAVYVKPIEKDFQIGAKQYINGLIKMEISQLKNEMPEIEIIEKEKTDVISGQIKILERLYNKLEWNRKK